MNETLPTFANIGEPCTIGRCPAVMKMRTLFKIQPKNRRHARLLKGKVESLARKSMSLDLVDSVLRTWCRKWGHLQLSY